jgi:hypothetical protein
MLKRILLVRDLPKDIAYYTTYNTLGYLLPKSADFSAENDEYAGKFSVMHIGHMNDPNEGKILDKLFFGGAPDKNSSDESAPLKYPYVFLKSFTTRRDDLSMWETYGDSAKGVCVVLDKDRINKDYNYELYNICYLQKTTKAEVDEQKENDREKRDDPFIPVDEENGYLVCTGSNIGVSKESANVAVSILVWLKDEADDKDKYLDKTDDCSGYHILEDYLKYHSDGIKYLFKDAAYVHEDEKRIIYMYDSYAAKEIRYTPSDPSRLFVYGEPDAAIKEIVLGPKFKKVEDHLPYLQYRCDALADRLKLEKGITIRKSDIMYI